MSTLPDEPPSYSGATEPRDRRAHTQHTHSLSHTNDHIHSTTHTHTYPSPQAPEAGHFGFGGHELVEAVGEGLLVLLGRLGVVGNSTG